ncbi:MAG: MFS transporter [bacterium]|nr:MFS transporter [bacterium]
MDAIAKRNYNALRTFYFFFYISVAAVSPYINLYFKKIGLTGTQIGTIAAAGPVVILFAQPLWGFVADKTKQARQLLSFAILMAMITNIFFIFFQNFAALILVSIIFTFFSTPIIPLADTAALEFVGSNKLSYGKIRLWGSVGFAAFVTLIGKVTHNFGLLWIFPIYAFVMVINVILSFRIPKYQSHLEYRFIHGLTILRKNHRFILFLLGVFLLMATGTANVVYFGIYIDQLGGSTTLLGFAWMIAAISEIPIFLYADKIFQKVNPLQCLIAAAVASMFRWYVYTLITNPILLIFLQPLHAVGFGCYYLGAIHFIRQESPPGWMATGQTLFWAVAFGLSAITGSFFGGVIYQKYHSVAAVYAIASIVAFVSAILFLLATKIHKQNNDVLRETG